MRILKDGHDRRFNNVRDSPGTFFVYWTIQGTRKLYECFFYIPIVLDQLNMPSEGRVALYKSLSTFLLFICIYSRWEMLFEGS